jgi:hypothetical protein
MVQEHATIVIKKAGHSIELINIGCLVKGEEDKTLIYSSQVMEGEDGEQVRELDLILDIFKEASLEQDIPIRIVVINTVGSVTTTEYNFKTDAKLDQATVLGDKSTSVRYIPNSMVKVEKSSKELLNERMEKVYGQYQLGFISEKTLLDKLRKIKDGK